MSTVESTGLEFLLAEERWVRRLARALASDGDDAEDVLQEARIAFWRRPPEHKEQARAWWRRVVTNVSLNVRRAGRRREALAQSAALVTEPEIDGDALARRLEAHRALG